MPIIPGAFHLVGIVENTQVYRDRTSSIHCLDIIYSPKEVVCTYLLERLERQT